MIFYQFRIVIIFIFIVLIQRHFLKNSYKKYFDFDNNLNKTKKLLFFL